MPPPPATDPEEIYTFFTHHLSLLLSSLPLLLTRLLSDIYNFVSRQFNHVFSFFVSYSSTEKSDSFLAHLRSNADSAVLSLLDTFNSTSLHLLEAEEIKTIVRNTLLQQYHSMEMNRVTWTTWIQTKFGHVLSADRTLAFYLWGTCRGLIICLALTSIIPGRLHGWTGRLLRFPILGMVYLLIGVELLLYIFIRFLIRALEGIFANSKHRSMRIHMAHAQSYKEWYDIASSLDISQDRYKWTQRINDDTAYRYSWPFILELLNDLQSSR